MKLSKKYNYIVLMIYMVKIGMQFSNFYVYIKINLLYNIFAIINKTLTGGIIMVFYFKTFINIWWVIDKFPLIIRNILQQKL